MTAIFPIAPSTMKAKPFIKWAGGKRQLLPELRKYFPNEGQYQTYYEPFMGAAAVFFDLAPRTAYLNDINPAVTNLFTTIRDNAGDFILAVRDIEARTPESKAEQKEYYYHLRQRFNHGLAHDEYGLENAALFMVINHRCFNGLFRVNSSGLFNVPFNGSARPSMNEANIFAAAEALRETQVTTGDFENALQTAREGDFIFLDSPYAPLNPTSFTDYAKEGFGLEDHERLAETFKQLDHRGCYVMMTNHDTPLIRDLYDDYPHQILPARRSINSKGSARQPIGEYLATNYYQTK